LRGRLACVRENSTGKDDYKWDKPLPAKEWPHSARRADIMEITVLITYPTEIFTDGSKIGDKVGAGVAIYTDKRLMRKYKYTLQNHCSNNQAEQIAILKSLEQLPSLAHQTNRIVAIYTDSKVTLDSLKNNTIHSFLIEEIRNMVRNLTRQNWSVHFGWVKAHTGIEGNEVADTLAKEAAQEDENSDIVYDRIPISTIATRVKEEGFKKWQAQWERAEKGALCKSFFLTVEQRLKIWIPITPEFTAIVSGHGKTKTYLHRFNCPCSEGEQSVEHLIHGCRILEPQRSFMIQQVTTRGGIRPPPKQRTGREIFKRLFTIC